MTPRTRTPATPTPTTAAEDLQHEISRTLTQLATTADLVRLLVNTRQDLELADLSGPSGKKTADAPVPGSLAAYSMVAEINYTLRHSAAFITRHLRQAHVCPLVKPLSEEPTISQLIGNVRALAFTAPSVRTLRPVLVDLQQLTEDAGVVVDGHPIQHLADPCPHCERTTLVMHTYPEDPDGDVVICGRDHSRRRDREYHPCLCKTAECPCHIDPVRHRHTWYRVLGSRADGWGTLGIRLIHAREEAQKKTAKENPTMATNPTTSGSSS